MSDGADMQSSAIQPARQSVKTWTSLFQSASAKHIGVAIIEHYPKATRSTADRSCPRVLRARMVQPSTLSSPLPLFTIQQEW